METFSRVHDHSFSFTVDFINNMIAAVSKLEGDFEAIESYIDMNGKELLRIMMQEKIDSLPEESDSLAIRGSDALVRTHKRSGKRTIHTRFGKVTVTRVLYSTKQPNKIGSIVPKDEALNLPERSYSHGLQNLVLKSAAKGSFDNAIDDLERFKGISIPKKSTESLSVDGAKSFGDFYTQASRKELQVLAAETDFAVITTDAKGVVVKKEDLREQTRKAGEKESKKKRLGKGEKKNRKRMAQVAAVYHVNRYKRTVEEIVRGSATESKTNPRPKAQGKRVWANLREDPEHTIKEAFQEIERRDSQKRTALVGLVDGNKYQIQCLEKLAKTEERNITIIVDIIHVIEYIWAASRAFYSESDPLCQQFVDKYLEMLLTKGPSQTVKGMRSKATRQSLDKQTRKPVDKACDYILRLKDYMNYSSYLIQGMPIGTGVIEGACRHLICDRLDITGARWSLDGAEAILRLRSIISSGDWDAYWSYHQQKEKKRLYESKRDLGASAARGGLHVVR